MAQPLGDAREMIGVRLVRREDQACRRKLDQQVRERRQQDSFIRRPRRAGDDRECVRRVSQCREARKRLARAIESRGTLRHAVVPRVAGDGDSVGTRAEQFESLSVVFTDRPNAVERRVRARAPLPCRPAQPRALQRHGGGDEAQLHAAPRSGQRQLGPHVELAEHERGRLQRVQHRVHFGRAIERKVVGDVDRKIPGEPLGRR